MTVTVYQSTDASAPSLTGQIGSLIAVLDACLVNGYGSKSAAGWAKAYSGTNLAAYRAASGTRNYLRVDDTGTGAANYARFIGYETMSDVNTGTNPFPTNAQQSGGLYMFKSSTADATARAWMVVASPTMCYIFQGYNVVAANGIAGSAGTQPSLVFGDIISYKSGDTNLGFICGSTAASYSGCNIGYAATIAASWNNPGVVLQRSFTGSAGATPCNAGMDLGRTANSSTVGVTSASIAYPDPVTGGIILGRFMLYEAITNPVVRGHLPGIWIPYHNLAGNPGDTFNGSGNLAGRSFTFVDVGNGATRARVAVETSNTWD